MKRWFFALLAALLCLGASLSAGWLWQTMQEGDYEARAQLLIIRDEPTDSSSDDEKVGESDILAPEILTAAADLLQERGVELSGDSIDRSITECLIERTRIRRVERAQPGEIAIDCTAPLADEATALAQAILDAYLASLRLDSQTDEAVAEAELADLHVEREQLLLAVARQKQQIGKLTRQIEAAAIDAAGDASDAEGLETKLSRIRQAHHDSAVRLAEARRDIDNKLSAETIAARIPDTATRANVLHKINRFKLHEELGRHEGEWKKWSRVYGRKHPRMVEIRRKIDELQEQLADAAPQDVENREESENNPPGAIVLAAFETEAAHFDDAEKQLISNIGVIKEQLEDRQELEAQQIAARKELEFLEGELTRNARDAAMHEPVHTDIREVLITPPKIMREPMGSKTSLPMAVACVVGMGLYLLVLSQIRARLNASEPKLESAPSKPAAGKRERFRSREEEQLTQLKMAARR